MTEERRRLKSDDFNSHRWAPNESQIRRMLEATGSKRSALSLVLRNQKVSVTKTGKTESDRFARKTVTRIVHFIYLNPDTNRWTGQIHRNQTEWQDVEFSEEDRKWYPAGSRRLKGKRK